MPDPMTNKNGPGMAVKAAEKLARALILYPSLALLVASMLMAADPTPCEPCRSTLDTWTALDTHIVTVYSGCQLRVLYRTRSCDNDGCFELDIVRAEVEAGSCNLDSLLGFSPESLTTSMLAGFLYDNPMNFPPNSTDEDQCWRIKRPRCWRIASNVCNPDPPGASTSLVACDPNSCCVSQIAVHQDSCGQLFFYDYPIDHYVKESQDWVDSYDSTLACDECGPEGGLLDCSFGCVEKLMRAINRNAEALSND